MKEGGPKTFQGLPICLNVHTQVVLEEDRLGTRLP